MNEKEEKSTQSGTRRLQRDAKKAKLQKEIQAIRQGHSTGGYIDTEALHEKEKEIRPILIEELEELRKVHGHTADPKFKHPDVKRAEVALDSLSFKPVLVEKAD